MTWKLIPSTESIKEGDSGKTTVTFDVEWTGALPASVPKNAEEVEISLKILLGEGIDAADGVVFGANGKDTQSLTLKIDKNGKVETGHFSVSINGDKDAESDETFTVDLHSSFWKARDHHGTLGVTKKIDEKTFTQIKILDDDTPAKDSLTAIEPKYVLNGWEDDEDEANSTSVMPKTWFSDESLESEFDFIAGENSIAEDIVELDVDAAVALRDLLGEAQTALTADAFEFSALAPSVDADLVHLDVPSGDFLI